MQLGVVYPQNEIEPDPGAVRTFTEAVEAMGFTHVVAYDHVLGANTASRPDWNRPYDIHATFHDPFLLFTWMAAFSRSLGFLTGILILPQRQTALVAKQAASLDILSGGRFRLGVGVGWNELEYESLGVPFAARGERLEEQVEVMRALWSKPAVSFKGRFHSIPDMGLAPLPVQRPIPVWFGGGYDQYNVFKNGAASEKVIRRIARMADGWIPWFPPGERARELIEHMRGLLKENGRDPEGFGMQARLGADLKTGGQWNEETQFWRRMKVTHAAVNTQFYGLRGVDQHLRRLEEFRKEAGI